MEDDVLSISGMFGAGIIEDAEKGIHNYGLIRRTSMRIFQSLKQARRSFSGSLSSVISWQNVSAENDSKSENSKTSRLRRPWSLAFGEEVKIVNISSSLGNNSVLKSFSLEKFFVSIQPSVYCKKNMHRIEISLSFHTG